MRDDFYNENGQVKLWAQNRIRDGLACKPDELVRCLASVFFGKKDILQKNLKATIDVLARYGTDHTDHRNSIFDATAAVIKQGDMPTSVRQHALKSIRKQLPRLPNRLDVLAAALTNRHTPMPLVRVYIPELVPYAIMDTRHEVAEICLECLEQHGARMTDKDFMGILNVVDPPKKTPLYTDAIFHVAEKIIREKMFFGGKPELRAYRLAMTKYSWDETERHLTLCADQLADPPKDPQKAALLIAAIGNHLAHDYQRSYHIRSIQMVPQAIDLAATFNDQNVARATHQTVLEMVNPTNVLYLHGFCDRRGDANKEFTPEEYAALKDVFGKVGADPRVHEKLRTLCRLNLETLESTSQTYKHYAHAKAYFAKLPPACPRG